MLGLNWGGHTGDVKLASQLVILPRPFLLQEYFQMLDVVESGLTPLGAITHGAFQGSGRDLSKGISSGYLLGCFSGKWQGARTKAAVALLLPPQAWSFDEGAMSRVGVLVASLLLSK